MDDLLTRNRGSRRSRWVRIGAAVFATLGILALVDAVRGAPPLPAEGSLSQGQEMLYRLCAAAVCLAVAGLLWAASGPRRDGKPGMLR